MWNCSEQEYMHLMKAVRVLIVDDSRVAREVLKELLASHPGIEVVGEAEDPYEAREKIKELKPDLLTLDVEMPRMDGITFLRNLMRLRPMPVVMLSSLTTAGADVTLEALEIGAVDFIAKPGQNSSDSDLAQFAQLLQEKILAAAASPVRQQRLTQVDRARPFPAPVAIRGQALNEAVIGIGASTGGTVALLELLRDLPLGLPPIVVTQHIPPAFSERLARRINDACVIEVHELRDGERLESGSAYLAPGDKHMSIEKKAGHLVGRLGTGDPVNRHRPSVEVMFDSLSALKPGNVTLVMLTGMGEDGAESMTRLRQNGVFTIAQDQATSMVWGMPGAVVRRDGADRILPLSSIAPALVDHYTSRVSIEEAGL